MTLRVLPTLLTLSGFACVIDPGVLEGGADEADSDSSDSDSSDTDSDSDEADSGTDTEGFEFAECLQGTNPQGGLDPGDFSVGTCPVFVCDEGWGHGTAELAIDWTLEFAKPDAEFAYVPIGVVARSEGDGVVILARRDVGTELSTVSAQGELLASTMVPTSLYIADVEAGEGEAGEGVIFLHAYDEQDSSLSVLAINEAGELLWETPVESSIQTLAALPDGGVLVTLIVQGGGGGLVRLTAAGETMWTHPTLSPIGLAVSPGGRILVTGHQPLEFTEHLMSIHESDGSLLGQAAAPGTIGELWKLHFLDEEHVLGVGSRTDPDALTGNAVVHLVDLELPGSVWTHEYNRAMSNCYLEDIPFPYELPTWEWFDELVRLPDGSFLIAATEDGVRTGGNEEVQPRVVHMTQDGEFLASDRGLWFGQGRALAVGDDGSAYAVLSIGGNRNDDAPTYGFYLRKYQP